MTTLRTAALLLCVLVLVHTQPHEDVHEEHHDHEGHHGKQKGAASCEIDTSLPCECTNPFLGTNNFHLGDAKLNCKHAKACYVANKSGCSDAKSARGGGRCQSKDACPTEDDTTGDDTSEDDTTGDDTSEDDTTGDDTTGDDTTVDDTEDDTGHDTKKKEVQTTKPSTTTTTSCPGGNQICQCLNKSDSCSKCEVDCMADCNDITKEASKCFSKLACEQFLLFDCVDMI